MHSIFCSRTRLACTSTCFPFTAHPCMVRNHAKAMNSLRRIPEEAQPCTSHRCSSVKTQAALPKRPLLDYQDRLDQIGSHLRLFQLSERWIFVRGIPRSQSIKRWITIEKRVFFYSLVLFTILHAAFLFCMPQAKTAHHVIDWLRN